MHLWLARHATPLVEEGTCYGALDTAADPVATAQAAQHLAAVLPRRIAVRHSSLQRCVQLAQALQDLRPDLTPTPDARLCEMDFGTWEGRLWSSIDRTEIDAWTADFAHHRPGGAESVQQFLTRVAAAWHAHSAATAAQLWITHAGVIRAAHLLARGVSRITRADEWPVQAPAFGQWTVLRQAISSGADPA
jgi:alpha-ribazole phosphatase